MTIILESNQSLSTVIVSFGFHLGNNIIIKQNGLQHIFINDPGLCFNSYFINICVTLIQFCKSNTNANRLMHLATHTL